MNAFHLKLSQFEHISDRSDIPFINRMFMCSHQGLARHQDFFDPVMLYCCGTMQNWLCCFHRITVLLPRSSLTVTLGYCSCKTAIVGPRNLGMYVE